MLALLRRGDLRRPARPARRSAEHLHPRFADPIHPRGGARRARQAAPSTARRRAVDHRALCRPTSREGATCRLRPPPARHPTLEMPPPMPSSLMMKAEGRGGVDAERRCTGAAPRAHHAGAASQGGLRRGASSRPRPPGFRGILPDVGPQPPPSRLSRRTRTPRQRRRAVTSMLSALLLVACSRPFAEPALPGASCASRRCPQAPELQQAEEATTHADGGKGPLLRRGRWRVWRSQKALAEVLARHGKGR